MLGSGKLSLKLTFKENKTCQGRRVKISAAAGLAPKAATFFQIDAKKKNKQGIYHYVMFVRREADLQRPIHDLRKYHTVHGKMIGGIFFFRRTIRSFTREEKKT
jgi:hypothetical protein